LNLVLHDIRTKDGKEVDFALAENGSLPLVRAGDWLAKLTA
jgi:hypothetical protein